MSSKSEKAVALLEEMRHLMHLKGENVFKVRAFERAAAELAGRDDLADHAAKGSLTSIEGVGKGIAEVLTEFFNTGGSKARDELKASLPAGLIELTEIPGLGPKKAMQLIEELDIHSLKELEYACKENRLLRLKGFGVKVQAKILEGIHFLNAHSGKLRLSDAEPLADSLKRELMKLTGSRVELTGAIRRHLEVMSEIELLVEGTSEVTRKKIAEKIEAIRSEEKIGLPVQVQFASKENFGFEWARTTATPEHWKALGAPAEFAAASEEDFYGKFGTTVIPPEARETGEEVQLAKSGGLKDLLPWDGVRGVFHNHTTRSDGTATLEEMVIEAKKRGYQYIGISDHSQSAFYAQGIKADDLATQEKEIRALQDKYPEIRIFWGIESDILADGSLDYDEKWLKRFDFVIASIHSRFKADRQAMTDRIVAAIRHPATRFVGHLTGRLLLGRPAYDLDIEAVIREAAQHDVAIEINANPARLDIDWRWGKTLREHGTLVSVNPDAHATEELEYTRYGVAMARKALLPTGLVVNSRSVQDVANWLARK